MEKFEQKFDQGQFADTLHHYGIDPTTVPLHVFASLPSTNTMLWTLLEQGFPIGTVVIALQQQSGRGQWGRSWQSPLGGLYLSWSTAPDLPIALSPQLTLACAWGIASTLRSLQIPVLIKWPNDLVLQGRKLGGILTETRLSMETVTRAVVGVGINWCNEVPAVGINLRSYLAASTSSDLPALEVLAATIVRGLLGGYHTWQQQGISTLLPAYTALLTHLGQTIILGEQMAKILGVSETGELQVRLQSPLSSPESVDLQPFNQDEITDIQLKPGTISLGYDWL